MHRPDRRRFLALAATAAALPPAIARAAAIDADVRGGTIMDVDHVVILMQENRSFDHYFGAMAGVRGFGDRFPAPLPDHPDAPGRTVFVQANGPGEGRPPLIAPFALNTGATFAHMRIEGTPHNWTDAQAAWDQGRLSAWPAAKGEHAMGGYRAEDIPFQFALAEAFTVCDAYHCSIQSGTNSNRLFLWTGTNNPAGDLGGPAVTNSHDNFAEKGGAAEPYRWTNYVERLQAAGISWRVYQDMADNFTDNPMAGFKAFRDAHHGLPGSDPRLAAEGLSTFTLDRLRQDVSEGVLPRVSYIVAPAADSEHPMPSSPAQGADFTARVIDALTANPKVFSRTVLFLMYDENDGFFDHMPPPAPPSRDPAGAWLGASSVDMTGEHHLVSNPYDKAVERPELMGRPYGLGPRVPMTVISPWSRGGWVDSQVFDHTSVIRFLERRFGVMEPNISPWRRAVCGDLTSAFDFKTPNRRPPAPALPTTAAAAARAAALPARTRPPTPRTLDAPHQARGVRPSRPLPYDLQADGVAGDEGVRVTFRNAGAAGAVFHVYDLQRLGDIPRRYTLTPTAVLEDHWPFTQARYDLWILGPNGFHRRLSGGRGEAVEIAATRAHGGLALEARTRGAARILTASPGAYGGRARTVRLPDGGRAAILIPTTATRGWYDVVLRDAGTPGFARRFAGRLETGRPTISDPAMGGPARLSWRRDA